MSDEQQVPPKITKEHANAAFQQVVGAINIAMTGRFPTGLEHLDTHMQVKAAVEILGIALKQYFEAGPDLKIITDEPEKKED